jgi:uridine kinase
MQKICRSIEDVEKAIFEKLNNQEIQAAIIGIDGKNGSGKSFLALNLCCRNKNFVYFDLDTHYWPSNELPYVDKIEYEMLNKNIHNTLNSNEIVILDAVCTLAILEKLSLNANVTIYIKKLDGLHLWIDGINFDYDLDLKELLASKKESSRESLELENPDLNGEKNTITDVDEDISYDVIRYHHRYKPDEKADIIYERICKS